MSFRMSSRRMTKFRTKSWKTPALFLTCHLPVAVLKWYWLSAPRTVEITEAALSKLKLYCRSSSDMKTASRPYSGFNRFSRVMCGNWLPPAISFEMKSRSTSQFIASRISRWVNGLPTPSGVVEL